MRETSAGWILSVEDRNLERAEVLLDAYDEENTSVPVAASPPEYGRTSVGLVIALLLAAFHAVTGPRSPEMHWFSLGSASAERILSGELWRVVTSLTLHADVGHVLANTLSCAIFATLLCRATGPGLAGWLLLLSGALGNLANAWVHGPGHNSVGASTAIFGAVGSLAGLQFVRWRRSGTRGWRSWLPVAGGLALLAMLGTGQNTDVSAHGLGLTSGALLGLLYARAIRRPLQPPAQAILLASALLTLCGCWWLALASRG